MSRQKHEPYLGAITAEVVQARYSYYGQHRRGKKLGLAVEYSLPAFVVWWVNALKTFTGKTPTVGRLDHSKGYFFDNIEMQDKADNSRERVQRRGGPGLARRKSVSVYRDGVFVTTCESATAAERLTGACNVYKVLRRAP